MNMFVLMILKNEASLLYTGIIISKLIMRKKPIEISDSTVLKPQFSTRETTVYRISLSALFI